MNLLRSIAANLLLFTLVSGAVVVQPSFAGPNGPARTRNRVTARSMVALHPELGRTPGQRAFTDLEAPDYGGGGLEAVGLEAAVSPAAARSAGPGEQREQQEADIFKFGPDGSGLLYLLTGSRGLRVVNRADAEHPVLVGRVAPTGNHPENMYIDHQRQRLVVVERNYINAETDEYNANQSRLLVYSLKNPEHPELVQTIDFEGEMGDSRLVGDILYVASAVRPDWRSSNRDETTKGKITSFNFAGQSISKVQTLSLSMPVKDRNSISIQESVNAQGQYSYYMTAIETDSGWDWSRQSQVSLYDINSPTGEIRHVMTAATLGKVAKRHWVSLINGTMIVTSNYYEDRNGRVVSSAGGYQGNNWVTNTGKVAVEYFRLPTGTPADRIMTQEQFNNRKAAIALDVELTEGLDDRGRVALTNRLIAETSGAKAVRGVFVQNQHQERQGYNNVAVTTLKKVVADEVLTLGDDQGMSANLKDVRYDHETGRLAITHVPVNQIDPVDIVDISDVSKALTAQSHLTRLQYPGWLEHQRFVKYDGHTYLIGVGYQVGATNNAGNRRKLQVKIMEEVTERSRGNVKIKLDDFSTAVLDLGDAYAGDLGSEDKFMTLNIDATGAGYLLFNSYGTIGEGQQNRWVSGGQLVGFNLKNAEIDGKNTVQKGPFLRGSGSYLQRVFTDANNVALTFSDRALGTYGSVSQAIAGNADGMSQVMEAHHVLELSRNFRAFVTMNEAQGRRRHGVQVLSEWSFYGDQANSETTLRLVRPRRADVERNQAIDEVKVPGTYVSHVLSQDGRTLLVTTQVTTYESANQVEGFRYWNRAMNVKTQVTPVTIPIADHSRFEVGTATSWEETRRNDSGLEMAEGPGSSSDEGTAEAKPLALQTSINGFVALGRSQFLLSDGEGLRFVTLGRDGKLSAKSIALAGGHTLAKDSEPRIVRVSGKLYIEHKQVIIDNTSRDALQANSNETQRAVTLMGMNVIRRFLTPVENVSAEGLLTLSQTNINIPGHVVGVWGDYIVTNDTHYQDAKNGTYQSDTLSARQLVALKIEGDKAALMDTLAAESIGNTNVESMQSIENGFVYVGAEPNAYSRTRDKHHLVTINLTTEGRFQVGRSFIEGANLAGTPRLAFVTNDTRSNNGLYLGVMSNGRQGQVIRFGGTTRPTAVVVQAVNADLILGGRSLVFDAPRISGYYFNYGHGDQQRIAHDPVTNSFSIAGGDAGACQVYLTPQSANSFEQVVTRKAQPVAEPNSDVWPD